ncbi:MAG: aldo/keto reductase [Candidatus Limnocylindrales bacterium]
MTGTFAIAPDAVDPRSVPQRRLNTGAAMPAIGLGTFGSDRVPAETVAEAVVGAAEVGYRHIDCASVYANEPLIGQALEQVRSQVDRAELFVTSKLWNDKQRPADVRPAFEQSLRDLRLDYLDLYLIHWPFPNVHAPGVDVTSRAADARPYVHDAYLATWRELETLVDEGLVRQIGTSNMSIPKLRLLLRDARIPPAANEMELHPHFQQADLFRFVVAHGIQPIGFSPIGSPARPDRDKSPDDTVDIEDPVIVDIGARLGVHPAVVCVKWAVQRGQVPIPFSTRRSNYLANLRAVVDEPLGADDMRAIAAIDRDSRLIKGQVFLWKDGQPWQDLWDLDGTITPP